MVGRPDVCDGYLVPISRIRHRVVDAVANLANMRDGGDGMALSDGMLFKLHICHHRTQYKE